MYNRFIRLSKVVINTNAIKSINMEKKFVDMDIKSYLINFTHGYHSGYMFGWFGSLSTNEEYIRINEDDSPEDYKVITDWINSTCTNNFK